MSVDIIEATDKVVMSEVVNRREKGKKALTAMLFPPSREVLLTGETVQIDELTGTTGMAPFVEKDGKAVTIDRLNGSSYNFETPAINIKRPLTCNDLLLKRQAGESVIYRNGVDIYGQAAERQIAEDLIEMDEAIENRIEWMAAKLLQGSIEYSVEGKASFKVSTAKPDGNEYIVSTRWDAPGADPLADIKTAKRVVQPVSGPGFMTAICGEGASDALTTLFSTGAVKSIGTTSGVQAGMGSLIEEWQANGMLYLGTLGGIPFFEYAGKYLDDNTGVSTPLIRTDYVEYIARPQASSHTLYYGAIRDMEAIMNGMHIARRFATSDIDKDAGTYIAWLKSRPFPWMKRPDWNVSTKVV
jgi:hypothetical protein